MLHPAQAQWLPTVAVVAEAVVVVADAVAQRVIVGAAASAAASAAVHLAMRELVEPVPFFARQHPLRGRLLVRHLGALGIRAPSTGSRPPVGGTRVGMQCATGSNARRVWTVTSRR